MYSQTCQTEIIELIEAHQDFNTKWIVKTKESVTETAEFYQNLTWEEWSDKIESVTYTKPEILFETNKGLYVKYTFVESHKLNNPICNPLLVVALAIVSLPVSLPASVLATALFAVTLSDHTKCSNALFMIKGK